MALMGTGWGARRGSGPVRAIHSKKISEGARTGRRARRSLVRRSSRVVTRLFPGQATGTYPVRLDGISVSKNGRVSHKGTKAQRCGWMVVVFDSLTLGKGRRGGQPKKVGGMGIMGGMGGI